MSTENQTIFNVNDTEAARYAITNVLQRAGYTVIEAKSGVEALTMINSGLKFDLVVLDVNLGDISGFDVCKKIKSEPDVSAIPVLHVSASYTETADKVYGLDMGADGYLVQPLAPEELVATVKALLRIRQTELRLRESESWSRLVTETIPQIVWTADERGDVDFYNEKWFEYTGLPHTIQRDDWQKIIHPEDFDKVASEWRRCLESFETLSVQCRLRGADGSYRWFLIRSVSLKNTYLTTKWFSTATDVDEQRRTRDELDKLSRELKEAVRARDEFMSIASHELKTPLTSLQLQSQLRTRQLAAGRAEAFSLDKLEKMIASDTRQISRLTRLVDDMLDISRISSGNLTVMAQEFDLCELINEIAERMKLQFKSTDVHITYECAPKIIGTWDRFRIEQVLINLLTNAMRYGAGKPIHVAVSANDSEAIMAVKDQGVGISIENQQRIFNRFERATSAEHTSGLGLGLYIVKQIVDAHHGSILLESRVGHGSTFTVKLPLDYAHNAVAAAGIF